MLSVTASRCSVRLGDSEDVVAGAKDNVPSHRYEVEPVDVDAKDDEHSKHKLQRSGYTPSVEGQDVSPLEALRSKPKASFNKSFRKANDVTATRCSVRLWE